VIRWNTFLDIGDVSVFIMRNEEEKYKELVIGYCSIFINTHNIIVMDISQIKNNNMVFRNESYQLWEQQIKGILLHKSKDFVTVSKTGLNVTALGTWDKRAVTTMDHRDLMIHSLDSYNFLKLSRDNYLVFKCIDPENKIISIQQERMVLEAGEYISKFVEIYNISIRQITLRQLLLMNSIFVCKTNNQIVDLVNDQPNP
jgi:hypothetical protein